MNLGVKMPLTLEYVAGLFDGEGWFQIDRSPRPNGRRLAFQLHARISLRQKHLLEEVQREFGGSLRMSAKATEKHAAYFEWDVTGENAAAFAERIGDHLRLKGAQAALARGFQHFKRMQGNRPHTDESWQRLVDCYEQMKRLNTKGPRA